MISFLIFLIFLIFSINVVFASSTEILGNVSNPIFEEDYLIHNKLIDTIVTASGSVLRGVNIGIVIFGYGLIQLPSTINSIIETVSEKTQIITNTFDSIKEIPKNTINTISVKIDNILENVEMIKTGANKSYQM